MKIYYYSPILNHLDATISLVKDYIHGIFFAEPSFYTLFSYRNLEKIQRLFDQYPDFAFQFQFSGGSLHENPEEVFSVVQKIQSLSGDATYFGANYYYCSYLEEDIVFSNPFLKWKEQDSSLSIGCFKPINEESNYAMFDSVFFDRNQSNWMEQLIQCGQEYPSTECLVQDLSISEFQTCRQYVKKLSILTDHPRYYRSFIK